MHATKDCRRYKKDGTVKADFCAAKKAGKKPNPAKQSFAQLSKKLDKLEKTLKKASHKSKKCCRDNGDSDSE
jgi:flagellar hook-basal body complex protein FliE